MTALVTREQAAEQLGASKSFVTMLARKGCNCGCHTLLPSIRMGPKMVRYQQADIDAYVQAHTIPPPGWSTRTVNKV